MQTAVTAACRPVRVRCRLSGRRVLAGLIACAIGAGATAAEVALPPDRPWTRVDTPHFELAGEVHVKQLTAIGLRLERLHAFLQEQDGSTARAAAVPTRIVVFRDDAAFAPYKLLPNGNPSDRSGFFSPGRDQATIGFQVDSGGPLRTALHEVMHAHLWQCYGNLPLWLNEGLAEYYSTFDADGATMWIGRPIQSHVQLLANEALLPFRDLFALDSSSRQYTEDVRIGIFYAESWALVHYLLSNPESRERLQKFMRLPIGKNGASGAFREAFGADTGALEYALAEYVAEAQIPPRKIKSSAPEAGRMVRLSPMTRSAVLEVLGDYLVHATPWRLDDAAAHFRAALQLDPGNARAAVGLGTVLAKQGEWAEARRHFDRAVTVDRQDPDLFLRYGLVVLDSVMTCTPVERRPKVLPEPVARARALFARSAELDSARAEAHAGLGRTYLYDPGPAADGVASLHRAHELLPARMDIAGDLMMLYLQAGDRPSAMALATEIEARAQDAADIRRAQEILAVADANDEVAEFNAAVARLNSGDLPGGIALLDKLAAGAADPALRENARRTAAEARVSQQEDARVEKLNQQIDIYNRAVRQANAGDTAAAMRMLEALVPEITDPKLVRKAKTLLHELRQR